MNKKVRIFELFDCRTPYLTALLQSRTYPWELLPQIKPYIEELLQKGIPGFTLWKEGILVGKGVTIAPTATILPPTILGEDTEVRPGAFLRGNVITGRRCVIGNSSELKNCLLMDFVQTPHYNYVGDSVLGNYAHMGAGAICSNLKAGGGDVTVHGEENYATGLRKAGAFLGDHADIGCGCVLNPGTVVGKRTVIYPLIAVRGVIPEECIMKSPSEIVKKQSLL